MMRFRHIEVFNAIMQSGSLNAAAVLLHVTQPGLSQVLKHAEQQLGFSLFHRTKGRLVPTTEARLLYAESQKTVNALTDLQTFAENLRLNPEFAIRVAGTSPYALEVLPAAAARLLSEHKGLTCDLRLYRRDEVVRALLTHDIDLGIISTPPQHSGLTAQILAKACFVAAIPASSKLARKSGPLMLTELNDHQVIQLYEGAPPGSLLAEACRTYGVRFRGTARAQLALIALSLARSNAGIALIDSITAASAPTEGVLIRQILPVIDIEIAGLWATYREKSAAGAEMLALVGKHCAEIQQNRLNIRLS